MIYAAIESQKHFLTNKIEMEKEIERVVERAQIFSKGEVYLPTFNEPSKSRWFELPYEEIYIISGYKDILPAICDLLNSRGNYDVEVSNQWLKVNPYQDGHFVLDVDFQNTYDREKHNDQLFLFKLKPRSTT